MQRLAVLAVVVLGLALTACRDHSSSGLIRGSGTLRQLCCECSGAWILTADSGRNYELTELDTEFQTQELRVRFALQPRDDLASGCMIGPITDVVAMTKL